MLKSIRTLQWRAVVVGIVVVLAMLAVAVPATAAPYWTFYKSYTSRAVCNEAGEDLLFSGRYTDYACVVYTVVRNRPRVDLLVHRPQSGPRPV